MAVDAVPLFVIVLLLVAGVAVIGGLVAAAVVLARRGRPRPVPAHASPELPRAMPGCGVALGLGLLVLVLGVIVVVGLFYFRLQEARQDAVYQAEVSVAAARLAADRQSASPAGQVGEPRAEGGDEETTAAPPPPPSELVVSPAPSPDAPAPATGEFPFVFHAPDYFEEWKRTFRGDEFDGWTVAAPSEGRPAWLLDAGGSSYERREIPGRLSIWSRFPGPEGALVGYSPDLEPTGEEARAAALRAAVEQLKAVLLWELRDRPGGTGAPILHEAAELAEHLIYEEQKTLITAEDTSEARLRAGTVHRHAIRVRADGPTVRRLAQRLQQGIETSELARIRHRRELLTDGLSALGLALCVFLIYCFLNAGTKGHFAWPLRIISAGALIVIFVLAFMA